MESQMISQSGSMANHPGQVKKVSCKIYKTDIIEKHFKRHMSTQHQIDIDKQLRSSQKFIVGQFKFSATRKRNHNDDETPEPGMEENKDILVKAS